MKTERIVQYCFAALLAIAFITLIALLLYKAVPPENKDTINIVIGALAGSFVTIVSYYFGSSKGSADKQEILTRNDKA